MKLACIRIQPSTLSEIDERHKNHKDFSVFTVAMADGLIQVSIDDALPPKFKVSSNTGIVVLES